MINFPLYKQGIKSNYKILLIFLAILTLYICTIISMYDPKQASILAEFSKSMPEMMAMVGMMGDASTLTGFEITYLYGFLFLVIPLVFTIIISNKLIASYTDKGSIAYLLASPNKRRVIIFTQMKVLMTFLFLLIFYCTILSISFSQILFPNQLEIGKILMLNIGLFLLHTSISGISFLSSCISNDTKYSLMFGAGIPFIFYLIQMLVNMGEKLNLLKYFTIFSLFDPNGIIKGDIKAIIMMFILAVIAIILYTVSYSIFKKKDFSV